MNRRTRRLVGTMALAILLLAVAAAYLMGHRGAPQDTTAATNRTRVQEPDTGNAMPPGPRAEAPANAELLPWLAGGWAEASTNCETDTGEHFNADGRYATYGNQGYWSLDGSRLTIRVTHELRDLDEEPFEEWVPLRVPTVHRSEVIREGPDRGVMVSDGERVRIMRCPLSAYEFTIPVEE